MNQTNTVPSRLACGAQAHMCCRSHTDATINTLAWGSPGPALGSGFTLVFLPLVRAEGACASLPSTYLHSLETKDTLGVLPGPACGSPQTSGLHSMQWGGVGGLSEPEGPVPSGPGEALLLSAQNTGRCLSGPATRRQASIYPTCNISTSNLRAGPAALAKQMTPVPDPSPAVRRDRVCV